MTIKEVELKYLITDIGKAQEFIATNELIKKERIVQTYVFVDDELEIRVRSKKSEFSKKLFYLTIKSGNGLSRMEVEKEIDTDKFINLYLSSRSNSIVKDRYSVEYKGFVYEFDFYTELLEGLIVVEIEVAHEGYVDEARVTLPDFIVEDVTENKDYKNKNLWKKINQKEDSIVMDDSNTISVKADN